MMRGGAMIDGATPIMNKPFGGAADVIYFTIGECSLGALLVAASETGVRAILIGEEPLALKHELRERFPRVDLIAGDKDFARLAAKVVDFVETPEGAFPLPLDVRGTDFQRRVWQAVRDIPRGATASYSDIAQAIGQPKAVRAVGSACAANPIAILIPCHRVIRSDGSLAGYGFGGCRRKSSLLAREALGGALRQVSLKGSAPFFQRPPRSIPHV
jgi:AraC family transcriptional regulator of adaptative response/methylated-DNA-[protein]-cysteine methyltransferase